MRIPIINVGILIYFYSYIIYMKANKSRRDKMKTYIDSSGHVCVGFKELKEDVTDAITPIVCERIAKMLMEFWDAHQQSVLLSMIDAAVQMEMQKFPKNHTEVRYNKTDECMVIEIQCFFEDFNQSFMLPVHTQLKNFDRHIDQNIAQVPDPPIRKVREKLMPYFTDSIREANFRNSKFQKWIYSPDCAPRHSFIQNLQRYLSYVVKANGGERTLLVSIEGYPDFYSFRLYDIDTEYTITTSRYSSLKRSKKLFMKTVKEYDIMTCICKRFLRIENAIYAYYHCIDEDEIFTKFATNMSSSTYFDEMLHVRQSENVYTFLPQILPYIRFNLIMIGEFMGISYYDLRKFIRSQKCVETVEDELLMMFDMLYRQYTTCSKEITVHQSMGINNKMIRTFLKDRTHYTSNAMSSVSSDIIDTVKRLDTTFFSYNEIEPILLLDYLIGTYRTIALIPETKDTKDDRARADIAYRLVDQFLAIGESIDAHELLKPYMINAPLKFTWNYELVFCSSIRYNATREYLSEGPYFKGPSKNPDGLLTHPDDYWTYLFNELEGTIRDAVDIL